MEEEYLKLMEEQRVPYSISFQLKELDFDVPCDYLFEEGIFTKGVLNEPYNHNRHAGDLVSAPLLQQVTKWFRDKHHLMSMVFPLGVMAGSMVKMGYRTTWVIQSLLDGTEWEDQSLLGQLRYEESELESINQMIKIIKKNGNG